jgi:ABC-2 type transport system permease protein
MSDFRAMMVVARRELLERVKSKWYVVMTLIGPIGMIAMVVVPALIATQSTAGTKVDIVDQSGIIAPKLAKDLTSESWIVNVVDPKTPKELELEKIRLDQINGFVAISEQPLGPTGTVTYYGDNASNQGVKVLLYQKIQNIIQLERAAERKVSKDDWAFITNTIVFRSQQTTGEGEGSSGTGAFLIAYILAVILYMVITLYGVAVMRSVVTEKTSRVMELMVAAVKPRALMAGKILGVGAAGLIQITVWLAIGALTMKYRGTILGWFGLQGAGGSNLPPFELLEIAVVLAFFVAGFFFYAAMYAAVGAMVSSEQETQQVQMPVTMLLIIGIVCVNVISNAPRGSAATVMSNVPLWSPMLMPMRFVLGGATLTEALISLGVLIASTFLVIRMAAKIYRTGVLMYGKRPGLGELVRWLRY